MFIGRDRELRFLETKYKAPGGQLVFLYGRRRVGKTETLAQFSKNKDCIRFVCTQEPDANQLNRLSREVLKKHPAGKYLKSFNDWEELFLSLGELESDGKRLVIIDEFPYIVKSNPAIPSIFQSVWDRVLKNQEVMIVFCGSSMSYIEKEILSEKNPLYGRATGIYKMEPMPFYEAIRFFPNYSAQDQVIAYSILGGIPYNLLQFDSQLSIEENIQKNILTKGAILYSEVETLLRQEMREPSVYQTILHTCAAGNTRLSEISEKSLIQNTAKTSTYLSNLESLEIIKRELPVDSGLKIKTNRNKGYYRIRDPYFQFWFQFIYPNLTNLEFSEPAGVFQFEIAPRLEAFASYAFEEICRQFMLKKLEEGALPFWFSRIGRWFGKISFPDPDHPGRMKTAEAEIDLMAADPARHHMYIGEAKFKKSPFSYKEYLLLKEKAEFFKKENHVLLVLFSRNGFDEKLKSMPEEEVLLFDLDEIVGKTSFSGQ